MSAKHTPGPWKSAWVEVGGSIVEEFAGYLVWPADLTSIQALMMGNVISSPWGSEDDAVAEANSQLTAAAPELLDALRPFAECAEHDIGQSEDDADTFRNSTHNRAPKITVGDLRRARAAIAKATGQ